MEEQFQKIEAFVARLKEDPRKTIIWSVIALLIICIIWFFSGYMGEKGRQAASIENTPKEEPKPDSEYFEPGWITYHRFHLNKENPYPIEIGNCPGINCYRISLGNRKTENGYQTQTIYLDGGGFLKNIEPLPSGKGFQMFRLGLMESKGGQYGLDFKTKRIFANMGLFKGASLRLRAIEQDFLFVVEDDRLNYLTVGVALYEGTYCKLYREGKIGTKKIEECED